jgi:polysaccharide biosynthesis/export protein
MFPLLLSFFMVSCHTREKLVYFQGNGSDSAKVVQNNFTPTLKIDDLLHITISGDIPELAVPFNMPANASSTTTGGYQTGNPVLTGYLIDANGSISLPVLGEVKLAGLSRIQASELIRTKLKDYLTNPIVQITIQNFKITILGDVRNPGTFRIPNERVTILEAIGLAGDLNITGLRNNILVIREEQGTRKEYRLDLTKKDILTSDVYYLQQNDIIYVEPNKTARSVSTMWRATGGIVISLTSLVVSTVILITR